MGEHGQRRVELRADVSGLPLAAVIGDLEYPQVHADTADTRVRHRVVVRTGLDRDRVRSIARTQMREAVSNSEQLLRVLGVVRLCLELRHGAPVSGRSSTSLPPKGSSECPAERL